MNTFHCPCGNSLYFANDRCLACGSLIAYNAQTDLMVAYMAHEDVLCANGRQYQICNWARLPNSEFCEACHFNKLIPNLGQPDALSLWSKMEQAKRRTLYGMMQQGLRFTAWHQAPEGQGLAFEFKHPQFEPVSTGYLNGVITIDLTEADDVERERVKRHLGESYRTLIGHFRHELGHYFYDQLLQPLNFTHPWRLAFGQVFGDPHAQDYHASLQNHYQAKAHHESQGSPPEGYISEYATSHPSEDWAETWAHYWHIMDALQTAEQFSLAATQTGQPFFNVPSGWMQQAQLETSILEEFQSRLSRWIQLSPAINEIATSLGHAALYPFLTSSGVMEKLCLVHLLVHAWNQREQAQAYQTAFHHVA